MDAPAGSRSPILRTALPVRLLFTVVAVAFVLATLRNLDGSPALVALLAILTLCLVIASLVAWTGKVWIDYDQQQICQRLLLLLQPALARNDRLPADDFTRAAILQPDRIAAPPSGTANDA